MFDLIEKYTMFSITIGGLLGGGIIWLTKLHYDVQQNRKLRQNDKEELIKEMQRIITRVDKVEVENSQTLGVLTDIKVQLSAIQTTLKIFLDKK